MIVSNQLEIKTVIDNTAATPFVIGEWGLSIWINTGDKQILFDTGAGNTGVLLHNLEVLNISVLDIDVIVLSHGHQDHTGGLRPLLRKMHQLDPNKEIEIICHPAAMEPQYVKNIGSFGCPYTKEELERYGARFRYITKPYYIDENIVVSGEVAMTNDFETTGMAFFREFNTTSGLGEKSVSKEDLAFDPLFKQFQQDTNVLDDMALYLKTDLGLMVILGCAHRGAINTINHGQAVTGIDQVFLIIGGTHTAGVTAERMNATVNSLKSIGVKKVGVSHCTGLVASCILSQKLGREVFFNNNAGAVIRFEKNQLKVNEF